MLRKIGKTIYLVAKIDEQSLCKDHALKLFELFQMNPASKSHQQLSERIDYLYRHLDRFDDIAKNKTWFPPKVELTSDSLRGFYRWPHVTPSPLIAGFAKCNWLTPLELMRRVLTKESSSRQSHLATELPRLIQQDGSIVIPGLFAYLTDNWDRQYPDGILPLIQEEIDMYDYHFRTQPNRPRLGWNRIMWHSLGQQLIRQDISYYMCYIYFRPDHAYQLISFPYYTKSTQAGEKTFFRHIDINIDDYVQTGRGGSILQGSVSLTDEDDKNCTEILPGIHRYIAEW